jgi:hypothetical protein
MRRLAIRRPQAGDDGVELVHAMGLQSSREVENGILSA